MPVTRFKPAIGRAFYRGRMALSSEADFGAQIKAQMDNIVENFKGFTDSVDSQMSQILLDALGPTFQKSQDIVPFKTGDLKDSGYLAERHVRGSTQVEIGYARGGAPSYAVYVHEDVDARHEPPTQAKFLQQPLEEDADAIETLVLDGIKLAAGV